MSLLLTATVALLVSAQAPPAQPAPRTWKVDGVDREATVYLPSKPPEGVAKVPLVFDFHGHGGNMRNAARVHRIHQAWPEAVVHYPQGLPTPGPLTDPDGKRPGWQHAAGDQGDRDLRFFDALLESLKKEQPVDPRQVFVTGHSNGGGFSYLLWAERGDQVAAIAPVAAAGLRNLGSARPKPVFHLGGKADPLVRFAIQERTIDRVKRINQCEEKGEPWAEVAERFPSKSGAPLVLYLHDGGHEYPTAAPALIARFFREVNEAKPKEPPPGTNP